ncbi:unnamed protein product [marine sediment metagenome]|uniref:Uncharacterized protein n=1 Tax=marine sediment metagenome TaxID=412755 RepID=X1RRZ0_9ZZZZ
MQGLALEDELLILAGYRTERPGGELSESMAELMDKARLLNDPQLKIMSHFADFLNLFYCLKALGCARIKKVG